MRSLNGWLSLEAIAPVRQGWPENIASLFGGSRHCASFMRRARRGGDRRADGALPASPIAGKAGGVLRRQARHGGAGRRILRRVGAPVGGRRKRQRPECRRRAIFDERCEIGGAPRLLGMEMRRDADLDAVQRRRRLVVAADEMKAGRRARLVAALAGRRCPAARSARRAISPAASARSRCRQKRRRKASRRTDGWRGARCRRSTRR